MCRSDESGRLGFLRAARSRTLAMARRSLDREVMPGPGEEAEPGAEQTTATSPLQPAQQQEQCPSPGGGRLSRLFSLRGRGEGGPGEHVMHPLAEEEEAVLESGPLAAPPSLPAQPALLSPDQTKRR